MLQKESWTLIEKVIFRFGFIAILLFLLSVPFPYQLFPDPGTILAPVFKPLILSTAKNLLLLSKPITATVTSDSTSMYIHALNVGFIAIAGTVIWSVADRKRKNYNRLKAIFITTISYYLSLQMLIYGFSKVFKWQFYLPELNTLFTTLGNTPKDLLYWSTMGMSYSYVMFMGIIEVLGALLLLHRRTRAFGAFMIVGIMLNVVMVNFGFDISVKCFSLFLLLLAFIISLPVFQLFFKFFIQRRTVQPELKQRDIWETKRPWVYRVLKLLIIIAIFSESLFAYVQAGNFNDDTAARPYLHGAWKVFSFMKNGDASVPYPYIWKRVFIHRQGYFIVQNTSDRMVDYKLETDIDTHQFKLKDYRNQKQYSFQYRNIADTLYLKGILEKDTIELTAKWIPLNALPVMEKGFHWTMDE